jgi:hypothetical protein
MSDFEFEFRYEFIKMKMAVSLDIEYLVKDERVFSYNKVRLIILGYYQNI